MAGAAAFPQRFLQYFTLSSASETAKRVPSTTRDEVRKALTLARQRGDAAETLWSNGHSADGLRLAREALEATLEAADDLASLPDAPRAETKEADSKTDDAEPSDADAEASASEEADSDETGSDEAGAEVSGSDDAEADDAETKADSSADSSTNMGGLRELEQVETPDLELATEPRATARPATETDRDAYLRARGVSQRWLETARDAHTQAAKLPVLDSEVSPAHADLYRKLRRSRAKIDKALGLAAMAPKELTRLKLARWATTLLVLLIAVTGLYFVLRTPRTVTASASGHFVSSPEFEPGNVFDGDESTEWLLDNGATGWVEGRLSPPRDITTVKVLNGHNRHFNDRAIRRYKVELFGSGEPITIEGEFDGIEPSPTFVEHPVDADGIERIRLTVLSFHGTGAALSELAWDE